LILAAIDWHAMFVPTESLFELVLRGSLVYLFIFALLRVFRREAGALSIADLLVVVLVADAAQNAMAADYHSVTEGAVIIATIFGWNYFLDWLAFRSRWFYGLVHPRPLALVKDGQLVRRNLRAELLTVEDVKSLLREQGIDDVAKVKRAYLESDGHISVIKYKPDEEDRHQQVRNRGIA
jgi:uncharacterized membrane protein YcaP (DUF421 family)